MPFFVEAIVRTLILPVLVAQGMAARHGARSLPEPIGDRTGSAGQGPMLRLLVIGDSSAAGVGVDHQADALLGQLVARLAQRHTVQFELAAKTGATTARALADLPGIADTPRDVVVVALGVNDVTGRVSLRQFLELTKDLLDGIRVRFDRPLILVSGLPPVHQFPLLPQPLRWVLGRQAIRFDRYLRKMITARDDTQYLAFDMRLHKDVMSPDGFHPGPAVYARWAEIAEMAVARAIDRSPDKP